MRHLVYRVQPLPQSMLPLVWDFGQLDSNVEKLYIIQMVQRCVCLVILCLVQQILEVIYRRLTQITYANLHVPLCTSS